MSDAAIVRPELRRDADTPAAVEIGFRNEVRSWLADHVPPDWQSRVIGASAADWNNFQLWWLAELGRGKLAAVHWPKPWGPGYSLAQQVIVYEEMARAGAPRLDISYVALNHAAATLLHAATEEQRQEHLPAILAGEIWCQGFSEPNAGSDLASLTTKAERDGDHYVVNGQKIWSSGAAHADWCLLLARTDPGAPKRKGISFFMLDMKSTGIEVRPIREMTGGSHFNEVFFNDVLIPATQRLGAENAGWQVAQSTLAAERGLVMVEHAERMAVAIDDLVALAMRPVDGRRPLEDDAELPRLVAQTATEIEVLRELVGTLVENLVHRGGVGSEASIIKVYFSELMRRYSALGLRLLGPEGTLLAPPRNGASLQSGNWMYDYLYSWGWTIGGGTNEILRTMIAERVLELPREPSTS